MGKSRSIVVKGPRGTLRRAFKHLAVDIKKLGQKKIIVEKWFGIKRELAAVRTVCSHIQNMFKGVMKGYRYKMRAVYAFCEDVARCDLCLLDRPERRVNLGGQRPGVGVTLSCTHSTVYHCQEQGHSQVPGWNLCV